SLDEALDRRRSDPEDYQRRAYASMARHVEAMVGYLDRGAVVFDYGNNLRGGAKIGGYERAFDYPGFVPAFIRPMFCEGKGPFRWAAGAHWVSVHHGGGVGIGYSIHAGMVVVADGTDDAAGRLERVLTTDPGMGVVRHADAGYERALTVAEERGVRLPWREEPS